MRNNKESLFRPHVECSMTADAVVVAARANRSVDLLFRPSVCSGCAGTCLWRRIQASRLSGIGVAEPLVPGTEVTVSLSNRRVLLAALLLHGMPLAAILLGAALGASVIGSDSGTLLGALITLTLAVACFRPLGRRLERMTLTQLLVVPKS
jgi:positive regulator of sigma E activity